MPCLPNLYKPLITKGYFQLYPLFLYIIYNKLFLLVVLTLFYLDNFELSKDKLIRYLQIFSPLLGVLLLILIYNDFLSGYSFWNSIGEIKIPKESAKHIEEGAKHIEEGAKHIGKGMSDAAWNIGLGITSGITAATVGKAIAKTSLPPMQKVGAIVVSTAIANASYVGSSAIRSMHSQVPNNNSSGVSNVVNKFVESTDNSPLKDLIFSIDVLNYCSLSLLIILFSIIMFKFFININFRFHK